MITCPITLTAINTACGTNMGGVKEVAIGNFGLAEFEFEYQILDEITSTDYQALDTAEQAKYEANGDTYIKYAKNTDGEKIIASIAKATLEQGADKMKKFAFREQTASFEQTLEANDNGINFWTANVSLVFSKCDSYKRLSIQSILMADTCAIVTDNNKQKWFIGLERPLRMLEGSATSGVQYADDNMFSLTLSCSDTILALPISDEAYNAIVE